MSSAYAGAALALASACLSCASPGADPDWVGAFGYAPGEVHSVEIGDFGFPYVAVMVAGERCMLPFDTGDMVGLNLCSALFDELGLVADQSYERLNSAGQVIATLRVAEAVSVRVLGRDLGPTQVWELNGGSVPGLVGPDVVGGGHFTLDYRSQRMGLGSGPLPSSVAGFRKIPLVRSSRHPDLILVRGTIEGRGVLIELDTGKSRTVIHPDLATDLALERGPRGVAIRRLCIGDLTFEIPRAKEVDQTGIDPGLPEPIRAGVGSDVLSRFVWTVDYQAGVLWIPDSL